MSTPRGDHVYGHASVKQQGFMSAAQVMEAQIETAPARTLCELHRQRRRIAELRK